MEPSKSEHGAASVDRMGIGEISAEDIDGFLKPLSQELSIGTYKPELGRRV